MVTGSESLNACALAQRERGAFAEAIALLRSGIERFPGVPVLHVNLAHVLYESGDSPGAIAACRAALDVDPDGIAALLMLYELLQITGERDAALAYQRRALSLQRLFSSRARDEHRSVLVLCAPGDFQANIPVDFLFTRGTTTVHKLYLEDPPLVPAPALPPHTVVWNAIAESPENHAFLRGAEAFAASQDRPLLNRPQCVLATARMRVGKTLATTGAVVAPIEECSRERLRGGAPFAYPLIARPVGSHAGYGLERLNGADELAAYLERVKANAYFLSPFIDYRSADGYFRKYRIIFVDGIPYPCHLAISQQWMIHYYNAPMAEHQWMRDEEARFLENIENVYSGPRRTTLLAIAQAVGLEYFGIDCTIDRAGHVFVFEADPAMIVHTRDPIELYPYKHQYVPRIYDAVERMIDARTA